MKRERERVLSVGEKSGELGWNRGREGVFGWRKGEIEIRGFSSKREDDNK
jgi:hypothetical protein